MKPLPTLILSLIVSVGMGQTKTDSSFNDVVRLGNYFKKDSTSDKMYFYDYWGKSDTIPVVAYCCVNFNKAKFKWIKMFAIVNHSRYQIRLGESMVIYPEYLMPDRKTKSIYKVAYCITK